MNKKQKKGLKEAFDRFAIDSIEDYESRRESARKVGSDPDKVGFSELRAMAASAYLLLLESEHLRTLTIVLIVLTSVLAGLTGILVYRILFP